MIDIMEEATAKIGKSLNRYAYDPFSSSGIGLSRLWFGWYVSAIKGGEVSGRFFFKRSSAVKYFVYLKVKYGLKE